MKVLHVIPTVSSVYGGPSYAIKSITRGLARLGVDVDVATTNGDGSNTLSVPLNEFITEDGVRYIYFQRQPPTGWAFSIPITRWLFKNTSSYDLIHTHSVFSYPTLPACWAARNADRPYIVRPLGTLDQWSLQHKGWKKKPYLLAFEKRNLNRAAAIHATSALEASNIAQLNLRAPLRVVPLTVPLPESSQLETDFECEPFDILFMARIHRIKGLEYLLQSLTKLQGLPQRVRLLIAGTGERGYVKKLQDLTQSLGVADRVQWLGFVEGEEKQKLLKCSRVLALPSFHESFGIAVAEALAWGLPVVISSQVGLAEEVQTADAGIVVPVGDSSKIAEALLRLSDPTVYEACRDNARALAEEILGEDRSMSLMSRMYQDVIANRT